MHVVMASPKEKHQHLVGTCMGMCPNAEVRLRQREKMIHPLEMAVDCNGRRLNYPQPRAMVKMFSRPAAGQEIKPSDVRPVPVLLKTLRYLLTTVCSVKDLPWALVYQFVNDRLQAIRQDLCVQGARNSMALQIYQAAVRFYVFAHYRTCQHEMKDFDPYLNMKQLVETLSLVMSLFKELDSEKTIWELGRTNCEDYIYDDQDDENDDSDNDSRGDEGAETKIVQDSKASEKDTLPRNGSSVKDNEGDKRENDTRAESGTTGSEQSQENERPPSRSKGTRHSNGGVSCNSLREEAAALLLLVSLGNEEAIMNVLQLPQTVKCSKLVSLALRMNIAWLTHNYYRVLKLSTLLPPLFQCAFHPHLTLIQRKSLSILSQSHSCKGQSYSLEELSEALLYNSSDDLAKACIHYGLTVADGGVVFTKGRFNQEASLMKPSHAKRIEDHLSTVTLPELLLPALKH